MSSDPLYLTISRTTATLESIHAFDRFCKRHNIGIRNLIVTDDQHKILSPEATLAINIFYEDKYYTTIMDAYIDRCTENDEDNLHLMYYLNYEKFIQNVEAQKVLLATTDPIVYKSNNTYWGKTIPNFEGHNILGQLLVKIRELIRENINSIAIE